MYVTPKLMFFRFSITLPYMDDVAEVTNPNNQTHPLLFSSQVWKNIVASLVLEPELIYKSATIYQ